MGGLLLFFCFFFMVSFPLLGDFGVYDSQRVVQIFFLSLWVFLFGGRWPRGLLGLGSLFFFLAGLLSVLFSCSPFWSFIEWLRFLLLFMFAFSISWFNEGEVCLLIAALGAFFCAFGVRLLVGLFVIFWWGGDIAVLSSGFSNHRHFTEFLVAGFGFWGLYFILMPSRKIWLSMLFLTVCWCVIFLGGARASALALFSTFLISFCLIDKRWRISLLFICSLAVAMGYGISAAMDFFGVHHAAEIFTEGRGSSGRFALWMEGLSLWWDHKLFGVGPMHFAYYSMGIASHPHNSIVQFLSEWGGAAFVALAIVFYSLYKSLIGGQVDSLSKISGAVVFGLGVSSLFGGVFVVPAVEVIFFLMFGICIRFFDSSFFKCSSLFLGVRALSLIMLVLTFLAWQWRYADVPRGAVLDAPRFWQNGGIPMFDTGMAK